MDIIKDIDKSDVVSASLIESPVLGSISPGQLSGGVNTLLLIAYDHNHVFNASTCGDNCAKWILKIAKDRKVVINLRHLMDFGDGEFKIKILMQCVKSAIIELIGMGDTIWIQRMR